VKKYGKILLDADSQVMVLRPDKCHEDPEKDPACPWVSSWLIPAANDVECGNTNWP